MTINNTSDFLTDLTQEQASSVEGGAALIVNYIDVHRSTEGNGDDLYARINGKRLRFKQNSVKSGARAVVHEGVDFTRSATVQVFDDDTFSDDFLGSFRVTDSGVNKVFEDTVIRRRSGRWVCS